jgi:hypothetical protein
LYGFFKEDAGDVEMKKFYSYERFACFEGRIKELEQ